MKTIMNKKLIIIIALLLLPFSTACSGNSPEQETAEEKLTVEQETEENRIMPEQDKTENETENKTENEMDAEPVDEEEAGGKGSAGMTEREQEYTYRGDAVLTKENFETYMDKECTDCE